jgi:hypothetical protein
MKKLAWSATLVVVGGIAVGIGGNGCTVTSSNGDDGGIVYTNDGSTDTGTGSDTGTAGDTGSGGDTGTTGDGGDSGLVCQTAPDTGIVACNTCIQSSCDASWCGCAEDTANVDDAGVPGCIQYVQCVQDCVAGNPDAGVDGGSPTECATVTCAVAPYTQAEQQAGQALLGCIVASCSSTCQ